MSESSFAITTEVDQDFEQVLPRAVAALKAQGFGVLTEVDVRATMQAKLGVDFRRYMILGVCNPPLAHQALSADLSVGLMLPCTVVVYDNGDGSSTVSALNAQTAIGIVGNPQLADVAATVTNRLSTAIASLNQTA